jgi:2-keto-4-pentenoate hydratase/2-oxohepta-3-ene-1,7-dioic acid hydratase in catechol pathway
MVGCRISLSLGNYFPFFTLNFFGSFHQIPVKSSIYTTLPASLENLIHRLNISLSSNSSSSLLEMAANSHINSATAGYTNYVAYRDPKALGQQRIGHLDIQKSSIQPLSFVSGTPISDLYQVIEIGESQIKPSGEPIPLSSVDLLAPISGRDILAVGKNYSEHAIEFNTSGYDSSDKVDQPTHPVIFTKRSTSIIAHGEPVYPHPGFTDTVDYEGEIGVIIGKSGFKTQEADAMDHVWGYTIINDMTARERQRDHKQFYIGKSPDTFCPMVSISLFCSHLQSSMSKDVLKINADNEIGTYCSSCKQTSQISPGANTRQWRRTSKFYYR